MNSSSGAGDGVSYLSQKEAAEIDEILMGPLGFSVDQLMEFAGLSVASAISEILFSDGMIRHTDANSFLSKMWVFIFRKTINTLRAIPKWFDDAVAAGLREPNAMVLSTANGEGKPSSRVVLLKGFDKHGFVWYTNYGSRKARDLSENCCAALLFHWNELNRQSSVVAGRHVLHQVYADLQKEYSNGNAISKPDYRGGYRLYPDLLEFWLQYSLREVNGKKVWRVDRLAP